MKTNESDQSLGVQYLRLDNNTSAILTLTADISEDAFDYESVRPIKIKEGNRGYVPWGGDNELPYNVLATMQRDEVMSSNMWFNITTAYGRGLKVTENGTKPFTDDIVRFFRRNNMSKFWAEQFTDIKHFFFSVYVVILNKEGNKIVQIRHREAINCRFQSCNPTTGRVENIYYSSWKDPNYRDMLQVLPLLDEDDPAGDLMIRMGKEPDPATGQKRKIKDTGRIFAVVNRIPTPGKKYYPIPYYSAMFLSGWSQLKALIPRAKLALMRNGMSIRYLVELHKDYFSTLYNSEGINDPEKQKVRKKKELENIKTFLSGIDNKGKSWFSTYYVDQYGHEQKMVKISNLGAAKEGGAWIEDAEEVSNIISYCMGVHPSLIGSSPGKSKTISGSEARELFTMKQGLEKLPRDLMVTPFAALLNEFNQWDIEVDIPDLMLTTLDKHSDAQEVSQNNDESNDTPES